MVHEPVGEHRVSRGAWMQTFTQRRFYVWDPRADEVVVEDIAHSLSLICRYNGHTPRHVSVAQHSVMLSMALELTGFPEHALWGLMHDAAEAYVGDMTRPMKVTLGDCFADVEEGVLRVIAERFGLPMPMPPAVHDADDRMLATEARLFFTGSESWGLRLPPYDEDEIVTGIKYNASPRAAEDEFLRRFDQLTGKR